ncbi:MAG TPA: hypothetical protein P5244_12295 [Syntrophales bacterium]|nr:hypothetical protein [Syntrophales bacterium]
MNPGGRPVPALARRRERFGVGLEMFVLPGTKQGDLHSPAEKTGNSLIFCALQGTSHGCAAENPLAGFRRTPWRDSPPRIRERAAGKPARPAASQSGGVRA